MGKREWGTRGKGLISRPKKYGPPGPYFNEKTLDYQVTLMSA
jgi:hypothetical protein